jgi:flagellar biosynthesis GTPase FlhF
MSLEHNIDTLNQDIDPVEDKIETPTGEPQPKEDEPKTEADQEHDPEEELVVSIAGEEEQELEPEIDDKEAPEWVKKVRKQNIENNKKIKELERENERLKRTATPQEPEIKPVPKPTLEECGFDTDDYEAKIEAWHKNQLEIKKQEEKKQQKEKEINDAWNAKINDFQTKKAQLKVKDYGEAQANVEQALSIVQQNIILKAAKNAAIVVYAIGKNEKVSKRLAAIQDPIEFAAEVAILETQLKVSNRKAPPPEQVIKSGGAPLSGAMDSTLAKLEAEAEKTGDRSKIVAYKRQLKNRK